MIVKPIGSENLSVYMNLAQAYEAEFSNLTDKLPDEMGLFEPDTLPDEQHKGFLLLENGLPIGFCVAEVASTPHDICEFYIVPVKRRGGHGYQLAESVFKAYPGQWQVRQIEGAERAIAFWRSVIRKATNDCFEEQVVDDPEWGVVTRQRFMIGPSPT